jgi:type II secretory pathway pseudopilin PulG
MQSTTRNLALIILAIVAVIIIGAYAYLSRGSSASQNTQVGGAEETQNQSSGSYTNKTFGYTLQYPQNLETKEITPEFASIGKETGGIYTAKADVAVLHAGLSDPLPSFDDFTRLTVQLACKSGSAPCSVVSKKAYTTNTGLAGEVWYLKDSVGNRGPFYTFNVSANSPKDKYAVLIVFPPGEVAAKDIDAPLITSIANSIVVNK